MLIEYENIKESQLSITEIRLYDDNIEQMYIAAYNNSNYILDSNFVFINKNVFYNFKKDTKNLKTIIEFRTTNDKIVKLWCKPRNTDHLIIKHYGNL